jgi:enamine deaminase RidA (YjgF/YER057c/UK114 family)
VAKKTPVIWNGTTRNRESSFSRGLIVSDYKELYFLTGQLDSDAQGNCRHPGDPIGQAKGILDSMIGMLEQEGWSLHDVIMLDLTVTKDVDPVKDVDGIYQVWADTFKDVNPKPASGTTRIIHALGRGGYFVEFEALAVR